MMPCDTPLLCIQPCGAGHCIVHGIVKAAVPVVPSLQAKDFHCCWFQQDLLPAATELGKHLDSLGAGRDGVLGQAGKDLLLHAAVQLGQAQQGALHWRVPGAVVRHRALLLCIQHPLRLWQQVVLACRPGP